MKRPLRSTLASTVLLSALFAGLTTGIAAQQECLLTVEPRQGRAGTEFELRGRGYTPDLLTLQRDGGQPVDFPIDLGSADPFVIPIASRDGDEGVWLATVSATEVGCASQATFVVTLPATDTLGASSTVATGGSSALAWLGVILVGLAAGLAVGHAREDRSEA
jgi:hypothetical protein